MYLSQRNGIWYFDRRIPSDLEPLFPSPRIKYSLKTRNRGEAVTAYSAALAQSEREISTAREKIQMAKEQGCAHHYPGWAASKSRIPERANRKYTRTFCQYEEKDILRIVSRWFEQEKQKTETIYRDLFTLTHQDKREAILQELSEDEANLMGRPLGIEEIIMSSEVSSILDAEDCEPPREWLNDPLFRRFYGLVAEGLLHLNRIAVSLVTTGEMPERFQTLPAFAPNSQVAPFIGLSPQGTTKPSISLDELINRFHDDPKRQCLRESSREEYRFIYRLLREHFGGSKPIASISRDDIRAVAETIRHIPAHATLTDKTTPLQTIAARSKTKGETIHIKTYNKKVGHLTALFGYAVTEHHLASSPAKSLKEPEPGSDGDAKRYDTEQLKKIFKGYFFTDFLKDGKVLHFVPNHPDQPCRFWVPLIGLFHGMRSNEILQIQAVNILQRDNIWAMKILGELKGIPSYRIIPIHPELIRIGFLDYADRVKKAGYQRLFPDAKADRKGKFSSWFQKPWAYYLRKIGVKKGRAECFHSFRHTWNTGLRRAAIPEEFRKSLGGWSDSSAESGYGAQDIGQLLKQLEKLSYPDLDLSHLYPPHLSRNK